MTTWPIDRKAVEPYSLCILGLNGFKAPCLKILYLWVEWEFVSAWFRVQFPLLPVTPQRRKRQIYV